MEIGAGIPFLFSNSYNRGFVRQVLHGGIDVVSGGGFESVNCTVFKTGVSLEL